MKRILILMATYNGSKYIETQLESILSQKNVDIEILISDDCSTDNTLDLVSKYSASKKITLISTTKKFGSASSNFFNLVEHASIDSFDYISFSDQDDIWFEDKLYSAISKLEELKYDGYSSDVTAFWNETNKRKLIKKSFPQKDHDHWFESPGPGCSHVLSANSFKLFQEFIKDNNKHLSDIEYHDWLIYAFYRYNNLKWIISNEPKMLYRQHANNVSGANHNLLSRYSRFKKIMNNWYKKQIMLSYELVTKRKFNQFIKSEKLIFKPFSLRRKTSYSIAIWLLLLLGMFRN